MVRDEVTVLQCLKKEMQWFRIESKRSSILPNLFACMHDKKCKNYFHIILKPEGVDLVANQNNTPPPTSPWSVQPPQWPPVRQWRKRSAGLPRHLWRRSNNRHRQGPFPAQPWHHPPPSSCEQAWWHTSATMPPHLKRRNKQLLWSARIYLLSTTALEEMIWSRNYDVVSWGVWNVGASIGRELFALQQNKHQTKPIGIFTPNSPALHHCCRQSIRRIHCCYLLVSLLPLLHNWHRRYHEESRRRHLSDHVTCCWTERRDGAQII